MSSVEHRPTIVDWTLKLEEASALDGADIPVVVGGIIPDADVPELKRAGVAAVYTPKDFELDRIMRDIVALVAEKNAVTA